MESEDINMLSTLLPSALVALVAVRWVYFKLLRIAVAKQLVDKPNARKLQQRPIPVMGGIAVFFGLVAGVLTGTAVMTELGIGPAAMLLPLLAAMLLLLYIGAMDDVLGLTPGIRLVFQVFAVLALVMGSGRCIDSFHGLWGISTFSWWLGVPLTVVAGVGIINAVNMIDGVNGLSSGMCIMYCALFGTAFVWVGDVAAAMVAFSMVAAQIPFLLRNVFGNLSRMYTGDAGTMVMGGLQSWFVICMLRSDGPGAIMGGYGESNIIAMTVAILSVPVFDTLRVTASRILQGRSPFSPDRTHLHHSFVDAGISHSVTALSEIFINGIIVVVWGVAVKLKVGLDMQLYVVVVAAMILVWGTYALLHRNNGRATAIGIWLSRFAPRTHMGHSNWWLRFQKHLDKPA